MRQNYFICSSCRGGGHSFYSPLTTTEEQKQTAICYYTFIDMEVVV